MARQTKAAAKLEAARELDEAIARRSADALGAMIGQALDELRAALNTVDGKVWELVALVDRSPTAKLDAGAIAAELREFVGVLERVGGERAESFAGRTCEVCHKAIVGQDVGLGGVAILVCSDGHRTFADPDAANDATSAGAHDLRRRAERSSRKSRR